MNVPPIDPLTVGAVTVKVSSPKVLETLGQEGEFYDPHTLGGRAETENTFNSDPVVGQMKSFLLGAVLNDELRRPLPTALHRAQSASRTQLLNYYISQMQQ